MASDSAASLGIGFMPVIGQQEVTKIVPLHNTILYSSTGGIGMSQLLSNKIAGVWNEAFFLNASAAESGHRIGTAIADVVRVYAQNAEALQQLGGLAGFCKSLVAIPVKAKPCLFQLDNTGIPEQATEELPFVALGSGQQIADPFLAFLRKILWKDRQPTLAEGRLIAAWTVRHVAETNPGGVALPLQMASLALTSGKPAIEQMEDSAEHFQQINATEAVLREHILKQWTPASPLKETPPAPQPPKKTDDAG